MKAFYLVRGIPGSGKSTLAQRILSSYSHQGVDAVIFEADDFFVNEEGVYDFKMENLRAAHMWCQGSTEEAMANDTSIVIVANTFTKKWEAEPYIMMARKYGYTIQIISCQGEFNNVHGVPDFKVKEMKSRWENFSLSDF